MTLSAQGVQAKDTISYGVRSGSHYVADNAIADKDTTNEKGFVVFSMAQHRHLRSS